MERAQEERVVFAGRRFEHDLQRGGVREARTMGAAGTQGVVGVGAGYDAGGERDVVAGTSPFNFS